jgi:hypothetical protein
MAAAASASVKLYRSVLHEKEAGSTNAKSRGKNIFFIIFI